MSSELSFLVQDVHHQAMPPKLDIARFYSEWKGHNISDLSTLHSLILSRRPNRPIIYLAGDSSLDNKYWVSSDDLRKISPAVDIPEIYRVAFDRPRPKPDIAFWLNH